jgi:serpin B
LRTLDFQHDPDGAVRAVNAWVDEHTNGKIRDLLHELDPLTRIVLVNAVYFKATWQTPFIESGTHDGSFHTLDGRTVTVPMMSDQLGARVATGDGWQAVDLPYDGDASMTIVVPDAGTFDAFERAMDGDVLARIDGALEPTKVAVTMPRFHVDQRVDLVPVLRALGMRDAFEESGPHRADFTGINRTVPLVVSQVVHQATIDVDEHGTEAAAATAIVIRAVSAATKQINVDRPFLYFVRDTRTGAVLFMGRVTDPSP